MNIPITSCISAFFCLCTLSILAQPSSRDSLELDTLTVSDHKWAFPPGGSGISSIQAGELKRDDRTSLSSSLSRTNGIHVNSGTHTTKRISIRGRGARSPYSTTKLKAYFGNIPLTSPEGITAVETVDPTFVQGIQISKGPNNTLFGGGTGGVIRLSPFSSKKNGVSSEVGVKGGAFGLKRLEIKTSFKNVKTYNTLSYVNTQMTGYRENNQYEHQQLYYHGGASLSEKDHLQVTLLHSRFKAHIPSSIDSATFHDKPSSAAENWRKAAGYEERTTNLFGLTESHQFNSWLNLKSTLFFSSTKNNEPRPFDWLTEDQIQYGTRSSFSITPSQSPFSFQLGWEHIRDRYNRRIHEFLGESLKGAQIGSQSQKRAYTDYFLQGTFQKNTWTITSGIVFKNTGFKIVKTLPENGSKKSFKGEWLPRIEAKFQPRDPFTIYASASKGASMPRVEETIDEKGKFVEDLEAEEGYNLKGGTRIRVLEELVRFKVGIYRLRMKEEIVAQRVGPDAYIGVNAGNTLHQGLEGRLTISGQQWLKNFKICAPWVAFNSSEHKFLTFKDAGTDNSGNEIPGIPKREIHGGLDIVHEAGWSLYFTTKHIGDRWLDDENTGKSSSYTLLAAKAGYTIDLHSKASIEVFLSAGNITNEHYASMVLVNAPSWGAPPRYFYPGEPRNYQFGLKLSFN